jgi:hypothetical protein
MPRQGFWWQTRSARREFPRRVSRNKKGDLLPSNAHPACKRSARRTAPRQSSPSAAGKTGGSDPKATGHLRACLELRRPPVKSCGEELKKMRRICSPNWIRGDLLPRRQEEIQVFRNYHRSRSWTRLPEVCAAKRFVAVSTDSQTSSQQQALCTSFQREILSSKGFVAVHILRNEMEFTRSARRGGSASNRRNSRCPRPRE